MRVALLAVLAFAASFSSAADPIPVELHQRLALAPGSEERLVALTLDACGGGFDRGLVQFLIDHRIPATIFATRRWIRRNADALSLLNANADLFDIEDHGANHVPAVIGAQRKVYGIAGAADLTHLQREVSEGAMAVEAATGYAPHWYRGATGEYDPEALRAIEAMGYKVAGFSVNADSGASVPKKEIVARLKKVKSGDIIIAHMNRPGSDTAQGLAEGLLFLVDDGFRFVRLDDVEVHVVPVSVR